ncbi:MAG: hypothetical protein GXY41_09950 [Phycisphaerae bacterium]|nr:hypothetical protein [Phycisphaerae bacterium]
MTKIKNPSIMLVVSVLLLSICQGELYSAEIERWDLMMIDSAHIWKNLLTKYPYAEHQKHWPERKTGLEQIVNKYPDSQWADDAALILACGKFEFEGKAGVDELQSNSEAYAKGYFGNAEQAIKDLRTIIDSYPHAKSIIDPVWFAGLGCKFNGVWLSSQGGLVSLNSDGTIQTSKPFDRSGAIPQKHKEVLAYFDHLEKYPVYTKHIAHLFISEILGHQGKFSEAASELEKVLSDLSEFEKAVKADNVAANGPDGVLIKRGLDRPEYKAFSALIGYNEKAGDHEKVVPITDKYAPIINQGAHYQMIRHIGEIYEKHGLRLKAKSQYQIALDKIQLFSGLKQEASWLETKIKSI